MKKLLIILLSLFIIGCTAEKEPEKKESPVAKIRIENNLVTTVFLLNQWYSINNQSNATYKIDVMINKCSSKTINIFDVNELNLTEEDKTEFNAGNEVELDLEYTRFDGNDEIDVSEDNHIINYQNMITDMYYKFKIKKNCTSVIKFFNNGTKSYEIEESI